MGLKWYTPDEFFREFGKGLSLPEGSWELSDPLEALKKGKDKIKEMISSSQPTDRILPALARLYAFSDKIFREYAHDRRNL